MPAGNRVHEAEYAEQKQIYQLEGICSVIDDDSEDFSMEAAAEMLHECDVATRPIAKTEGLSSGPLNQGSERLACTASTEKQKGLGLGSLNHGFMSTGWGTSAPDSETCSV